MKAGKFLVCLLFLVGCGGGETVKQFEGESNVSQSLTEGKSEAVTPTAPGRVD